MESARETETDSFEDSPLTPTRIAIASAAMDVVVFTAVGYLAVENVALGAVSGLMLGTGVFLFLPLFMHAGEDSDLEALAPADDGAPLRGFHRLAAGLALAGAGLVLFATGFLEVDLLVGLPAALLVTAVGYLGIGFALPNAQLRTDGLVTEPTTASHEPVLE